MEDDLKFLKMEDDLKYFRIFLLFKWKTPQFFVNKIIMQPETFQFETMVVAPLRVTLYLLKKEILTPQKIRRPPPGPLGERF